MVSRLHAVCVVLALCCYSAYAQTGPSPAVPCMADTECPVLTLDAFLNQVLQASPSIQSLRLEDDRARAELLDARGGFSPYFESGYEYKTQGSKNKVNVFRGGVALPFNMPMSPTLTLDYRRGLGSSIDPSVLTSLAGETRFGVSFAPLQGFTTDKRRATLRKARLEPRRADALQARGRNRVLLDATGAYWTWVEARRTLSIQRDLLELATRRQAFIIRRARIGEAAAIDSIEAKLAVANRAGKVIAARRKAQQASVKLAVFLWNDDGTPKSPRYDPPTVASLPMVADSAGAVATALNRRPELQVIAIKEQQLLVERRLAREQLRPDVKLEAQVVSYENSPFDANDVKLGFKINQPLFFRAGRSEVERAEIDTQALRFKQDLTRRKVRADVEAALIALRQSRQRVATAERRTEFAQRLQQAEQRRFELGESTLFLVNNRETAFAEAREELVAAQIDVLQAYATYQWARGTIGEGLDP